MIKAIQWNIERGYEMDRIIPMLKRHQADIICLQELDIGCERTSELNVPKIIAKELKMNCFFVVEFVEHHSSKRSARTQGGGVHGNAILSRFDMSPFTVPHSHHPVDWPKDGRNEPRDGERVGFGANIVVPGISHPLRVYSLHLEVFCGIFGRLRQFADIMADAKEHLEEQPYQLIFGDLNTMAHGIARLSPFFCGDRQRIYSIGYSEAQWWQQRIFDHATSDFSKAHKSLAKYAPGSISHSDALALTNPHFYDPFSMTKDTTLHSYFGLYRGKLDWTLIRGFHTLAKGMDNHDFKASDHKLLYVVIKPCSGGTRRKLSQDIEVASTEGRVLINHGTIFVRSILTTFLSVFLAVYLAVKLAHLII